MWLLHIYDKTNFDKINWVTHLATKINTLVMWFLGYLPPFYIFKERNIFLLNKFCLTGMD